MSADVDELVAIINEAGLFDDPSLLSRHRPLAEQGIDSLTSFHIFLIVEERYGVKIADEDIPALVTLDDIASFVNSARRASRVETLSPPR